jgi:hypothetical protein
MTLVVLSFLYYFMIRWFLDDLIVTTLYDLSDWFYSYDIHSIGGTFLSWGFQLDHDHDHWLLIAFIMAIFTIPYLNDDFVHRIDTENVN